MNILTAENISKSYAAHRALKNVSIDIPEQSIFGLLGPNGAGKTTFIRIITRIIAPDAGQVLFRGEPLSERHIAEMGYLPEERGLYKKMKVGEQLLYLARLKGMLKSDAEIELEKWLEKFEIQAWRDKQVEDLSKGMQQKIQFIATVIHRPKLIILDEPFSGFDPVNADLVKAEILRMKSDGATIIFSTHRMESVEELCDYIVMINRSEKVLDGTKRSIKEMYKTHMYSVVWKGNPVHLSHSFSIISNTEEDGLLKAEIRINDPNISANKLLEELMGQVEIRAFSEKVPSMSEIFIAKVKGYEP